MARACLLVRPYGGLPINPHLPKLSSVVPCPSLSVPISSVGRIHLRRSLDRRWRRCGGSDGGVRLRLWLFRPF